MKNIIILIGVSGSGKSTVGKALSEKLGILFIDGDDFHSLDNIEKMKKSIPLNDKDRKPWLIKLSKKIFESPMKFLAPPLPSPSSAHLLLTHHMASKRTNQASRCLRSCSQVLTLPTQGYSWCWFSASRWHLIWS